MIGQSTWFVRVCIIATLLFVPLFVVLIVLSILSAVLARRLCRSGAMEDAGEAPEDGAP